MVGINPAIEVLIELRPKSGDVLTFLDHLDMKPFYSGMRGKWEQSKLIL